jgi:hypothetical protein
VLRGNWVATLRRLVGSPTTEQCELCRSRLGATHPYLVEPAIRRLLCACESCVGKIAAAPCNEYQIVPGGARLLPDFQMTDAEWDALRLPIDMAFLFHSTPAGRPVAVTISNTLWLLRQPRQPVCPAGLDRDSARTALSPVVPLGSLSSASAERVLAVASAGCCRSFPCLIKCIDPRWTA